jgi:hypothetical protein
LTVAVIGAGCARPTNRAGGFDLDWATRASFDYTRWEVDLGESIQTTPAHPDDVFLSGETTADLDGREGSIDPKLGLEGSLSWAAAGGWPGIRLRSGFDVRLNTLAFRDDFRQGHYEIEQQVSDFRPPSSGSFVFTHFDPDYFSLLPFVGADISLTDTIRIAVDAGLPYSGFTVRSGHDRFARWQTLQKDDWSGFGRSLGVTLSWDLEDVEVSAGVRREEYDAEFAGEDADVKNQQYFLGIRFPLGRHRIGGPADEAGHLRP